MGRSEPLRTPPTPPKIDEPITRLVASDIGLPELFAKNAGELKMLVTMTSVNDLIPRLVAFLRERKCSRIMLSDTPLLTKLNVAQQLSAAGFTARTWNQISLDESYEFDAGVTDVDYAVAENGTLAICHRPGHGRAISLVPFVHVAIVEPKNFIPDMLDLFEKLPQQDSKAVTLISGPSKTADIEMNVVTGVHGPNVVQAFILQ